MFERFVRTNKTNITFVQEKIVLKDISGDYHYIHFISRAKNLMQIETIAEAFKEKAK